VYFVAISGNVIGDICGGVSAGKVNGFGIYLIYIYCPIVMLMEEREMFI